jgi:hypothetical protein
MTHENDKAILLSAGTVRGLLVKSADKGHFVPAPVWFGLYTRNRPPDLYLSQRQEFEELFSAANSIGENLSEGPQVKSATEGYPQTPQFDQ